MHNGPQNTHQAGLSRGLQVVLAEYGLGAVALYYLAPFLLGSVFGSLRGYAGEVSAAQALDLVANDGGAVIIDIRTEVGAVVTMQLLILVLQLSGTATAAAALLH